MSNLITLPGTSFVPDTEGLFNIPDTIYHNHKLAPAISRGMVVEMITKTPAHVKVLADGTNKKEPSPAMIMGTLMDKALLEPDRFKEGLSHWVKPEGIKLSTKDGIKWKEDHAGLPFISTEENTDIKCMIESIMRHSVGRQLVERSVKQESSFCIDPDTCVMRKCRPDVRMEDNDGRLMLADLKTTFVGGTNAGVWSSHCAKMGYHYQDAYYSDIYRDLVGEAPYFIFMPVERKPPYSTRIFQVHHEGIQFARERYKHALESFAKCKASGEWPAYPEVIETVRLPSWEMRVQDPIVHE